MTVSPETTVLGAMFLTYLGKTLHELAKARKNNGSGNCEAAEVFGGDRAVLQEMTSTLKGVQQNLTDLSRYNREEHQRIAEKLVRLEPRRSDK